MTRHCNSWGDLHASPFVKCELCGQRAAFHWYGTYPDLLLCLECLECFPEAQEPRDTRSHLKTDSNVWSETCPK
jgi:hypothetical protein